MARIETDQKHAIKSVPEALWFKHLSTNTTQGMAPKAMKTAMKALTKGKAKASSPMKATVSKGILKKKPLAKGKSHKRMDALKAHNLKKLGKMKLAERIEKIAETAETPGEAATTLKETLTKGESSNVWSAHNTFIKKNPEAKERFDQLSKRDKGLAVALYMVRSRVPKFMNISDSYSQSSTLDKREKWESETAILQRFSREELDLHLISGRITWRQDPWTPSVVEYCDLGDITKTTSAKRQKTWSQGQEYGFDEEAEKEWNALGSRDLQSQLLDVEGWGKGHGKSKSLSLAKGAGKGKSLTKGKKPALALEDWKEEENQEEDNKNKEEKTPEQEWHECLNKVKKARDALNSVMNDFEQALHRCDLAKRLTKTVKKEADTLMAHTTKKIEELKTVLMKKQKAMSLSKVKTLLGDAAACLKDLKEEVKEMNQMANKAASKASKK